jgi:BASS family bile acid:Na+ symporter
MSEAVQKILNITLVLFMVGNLLEMGLKLNLREAFGALRNVRFVVLSLLWGFVLCPAFALLLMKIIPLAEPYALGLLFLSMAPGAPFLPAVAQKARGDLAYVAAFMLLTAVGTVVFMPLAVPVLINGFSANSWTIAKPLVFYIALPLVIGVAIRLAALTFAEKSHPFVKKITAVDSLILLAVMFWIYGGDFLGAVGSYAIGTQILYFAIVTSAAYGLGFGLPPSQKSVLALGLCTRNIGAAVAPLMADPGADQRAIVMCCLAMVITILGGIGAAVVFGRLAPSDEPVSAGEPAAT